MPCMQPKFNKVKAKHVYWFAKNGSKTNKVHALFGLFAQTCQGYIFIFLMQEEKIIIQWLRYGTKFKAGGA